MASYISLVMWAFLANSSGTGYILDSDMVISFGTVLLFSVALVIHLIYSMLLELAECVKG
jgi:hypothetical protein